MLSEKQKRRRNNVRFGKISVVKRKVLVSIIVHTFIVKTELLIIIIHRGEWQSGVSVREEHDLRDNSVINIGNAINMRTVQIHVTTPVAWCVKPNDLFPLRSQIAHGSMISLIIFLMKVPEMVVSSSTKYHYTVQK